MKIKSLPKILFAISAIWFLALATETLVQAVLYITGKKQIQLFPKNVKSPTKLYYLDLERMDNNGYKVPVSIAFVFPEDSLLVYETKNQGYKFGKTGKVYWPSNNIRINDLKNKRDEIMRDTSFKKTMVYINWKTCQNTDIDSMVMSQLMDTTSLVTYREMQNKAEINPQPTNRMTAGDIRFSTTNPLRNSLMFLYNFVGILVGLFCSFQSMKLFYKLSNSVHFYDAFPKTIFSISTAILATVFIKWIASIIFASWYDSVMLTSYPKHFDTGETQVRYYSRIDFDGTLLLFAMILIIIGSLVKYGATLEKEQSLTI